MDKPLDEKAREAIATEIDRQWRAKGRLNCTEVCAIVRGYALAEATQACESAEVTEGTKFPTVCDGMEQEVFEACATRMYMDMTIHPLHYIFLNEKTDGMRKGWREAIFYCGRVHSIIVEKMNDNFAAVQADNERLLSVLEDLLSWFPDSPRSSEWSIKAGVWGADGAIDAARAALEDRRSRDER